MTELDRYRRALEKIRDYNEVDASGWDEWSEAAAFRDCQQIAGDALDPEARKQRIQEERKRLAEVRRRVRSLSKQAKYWLPWLHQSEGLWVRFLRGDDKQLGTVHLKVLEVVNEVSMTYGHRAGDKIKANVSNLQASPGVGLWH